MMLSMQHKTKQNIIMSQQMNQSLKSIQLFPFINTYLIDIYKLMDSPDSDLIKYYGTIFAQNYKLPSFEAFTAIFGHRKSGKSVFIDLLAGKKLIINFDPQLQLKVLVQKDNFEAEYPIICVNRSSNSMLLLEGFNLDPDTAASSTEILKLVFLRQFIEQSKKAAFVILVEENQKESLLSHMQNFFKFLGITQQHKEVVDLMKENVYLMLTKIEEGQFEDAKGIIEDLAQNQCSNQNVAQIIKYLLQKGRIQEFRIEEPNQNFEKQIKKKLTPKPYDSKALLSLLEKSVLKSQAGLFSEEQQKNVLEKFEKTAKLINYLILYASNEDRASERQYQKLAKDLYPDHKRKNQVQTMLGKFNRQDLQSLNLQPKLTVLKGKDITLKTVLEVVIELVDMLQRYSEAWRDYEQIAGKLIFLQDVANWLEHSQVGAKAREIADFFISNLEKVQQIYERSKSLASKSKPEAPVAKSKVGKTPGAKKADAALKSFYQAIEQCKNNREAILLCLSTIKSKQKQVNFDYFQVIYYIRLLKDLLDDFDCRSPSDRPLFIKQLIQLALLSQNYFDLQNYVKRAIRSMALTFKEARSLILTLNQNGKYELSEMLIDYMIAQCTDDATFKKLVQLKARNKADINKEYTSSEREGQKEVKKRELLIDETSLFGKKNKGSELNAYLAGNDYERHISAKQ